MEQIKNQSYREENYTPDLLGDGFEQMTLNFNDDYEGEVIATLIRKKSPISTDKAILYIHGFNDYFFQAQMANWFIEKSYNFYALDLRKYGRSLMEHQKMNNVRSLLEYDEEINEALHIINIENNKEVILLGHSTGGLITTSYAGRNLKSDLFHGMICNSPFYEFNISAIERKLGIPVLASLSKLLPNMPISGGFSEFYGYSIHEDKYGEWDYSIKWKPHDIPKVNLSFISAIRDAHKIIQGDLVIDVPTIVLHSSQTIKPKKWSEQLKEGDAILNVDHIRHYANRLKGDITTCEIENGMHDLVLSKKPVREKVYLCIFDWIDDHFN